MSRAHCPQSPLRTRREVKPVRDHRRDVQTRIEASLTSCTRICIHLAAIDALDGDHVEKITGRQSIRRKLLAGMPSAAIFPPWLMLAIMSLSAYTSGPLTSPGRRQSLLSSLTFSAHRARGVLLGSSPPGWRPSCEPESGQTEFKSSDLTTCLAPAWRTTGIAMSPDRSRTGDQDILAHILGKRGAVCTALPKGIENGPRPSIPLVPGWCSPNISHRRAI